MAVLFLESGEHLIRQFYSEVDMTTGREFEYNEFRKQFRIHYDDGKLGILSFRKLYPIYNLSEKTELSVGVSELNTQVNVNVEYGEGEEEREALIFK